MSDAHDPIGVGQLPRGRALAKLAAKLELMRMAGWACWRCHRLLAAGAACPEHGRAQPWALSARDRRAARR